MYGNLIHDNTADGILFDDYASDNAVGTGSLNHANEVHANGGAGVRVVSGERNTIGINAIYDNGGLGVDLGSLGVTDNDGLDADGGANLQQNFPVFTSASFANGSLQFAGYLQSTPNSTFTIQLYLSSSADPSGHGEGRYYIGSVTVGTDADGYGYFAGGGVFSEPPGLYLSGLATDVVGNTSEFALCLAVTVA